MTTIPKTLDDIPDEHRAQFAAFEVQIDRSARIQLDTFAIDTTAGRLTFVHEDTGEVIAKIQEALTRMQDGVTCEEHGESVQGDKENIRLGVYSGRDLVGIWYIGAIYVTTEPQVYRARFMPYFPELNDADSATVTAEIVDYLLSNELPAAPSPIRFVSFRYVIKTAKGDADDTRAQVHHGRLLNLATLEHDIGDTIIAEVGRFEVTLRRRG
jgi:hypothetical protein